MACLDRLWSLHPWKYSKKTKKKRKQKKSIGYSPEQPAEMTLFWAGGLDYLRILRGPFWPQPFIWFSDIKIKKKKKSQEYVAFLRKNIFNILLLNHILWNNASSSEEGDTLKPLCTVPVSPPSQLLQLLDTLKWQEARKMLGYLEHSSLLNSMDSDSIKV